jgi:hypothetical protein
MDRRRFLLGLAGAFAAATLMASGSKMAEALPLQPPPDLPPDPIPEPAVATEADLEAAKAQEAYWVVRRRRYWRPWRRRYWRRRYYYRPYRWRRRYWRRRYWRRRYWRRRYWRRW